LWGSVMVVEAPCVVSLRGTPTPDPSPQGGGERIMRATKRVA
jgi:hypothetical protein